MVSQSEMERRLRSLVDGESAAAAWLYDTFAPALRRRLRGRYGGPGGLEVDDLLHDAFVLYLQNRARVIRRFLERVPAAERTPARLELRLWDLACGVASNRRRSRRRSTVVPIRGDRTDPAPDAERSAVSRDRLLRLVDCLERRGSRIRLYYSLRYRDGLRPEEISRVTGWSRKATYKLKQALDRAVEGCVEELDAGGP